MRTGEAGGWEGCWVLQIPRFALGATHGKIQDSVQMSDFRCKGKYTEDVRKDILCYFIFYFLIPKLVKMLQNEDKCSLKLK